MSEERLKEIKDSIDFQDKYFNAIQKECCFVDEELELYNEVIRLREIIDKVNDKVNCYEVITGYYDSNYDGEHDTYLHDLKDDLLNILKENNNDKIF